MSTTLPDDDYPIEETGTRRDFIHLLSVGLAGAAAVGVGVVAVDQMNPSASVRALATKEVNIAGIEPGMAIKAMWQGKPVFLRRLTEAERERQAAEPLSETSIKDKASRNPNEGASEDAGVDGRVMGEDFVIVLGVCTHLGCVPLGTDAGDNRGEYGGWFCPCHGSHYDAFGRIRKGPAPQNLAVPPLEFLSETTVRLG